MAPTASSQENNALRPSAWKSSVHQVDLAEVQPVKYRACKRLPKTMKNHHAITGKTHYKFYKLNNANFEANIPTSTWPDTSFLNAVSERAQLYVIKDDSVVINFWTVRHSQKANQIVQAKNVTHHFDQTQSMAARITCFFCRTLSNCKL